MADPSDNPSKQAGNDDQPNKRRRKKSIVWEYFTIETVDSGCSRAFCKQCKKSFAYITGSKLAGTSHLKRHIALGICPVSHQKNDSPRKVQTSNPGLTRTSFDQDRYIHHLAKMIILHEYPINIVEDPGFGAFVQTIQPQFSMTNVGDVIMNECLCIYEKAKQELLNIFTRISSRVNVTLDFQTSSQGIDYVVLSAHFIDNNWNLHKRILNVVMVPFLDSESSLHHALNASLAGWGLNNNIFTITLDSSFASQTLAANLRCLLSVKHLVIFKGQLLIENCYARQLSRLAQDVLDRTREIIKKVRDCVKYVKTSEVCEEKFNELKEQLQFSSTKSLSIDDQTNWSSTYHMLVAAYEVKEIFACLETFDQNYKDTPTMDEWKQVETMCIYLKLLFDAADTLTSTNLTADSLFHQVWKIQLELRHSVMSDDAFVTNLTKPMKEKFDKYWNDCSAVFAAAVVMDPRFKMKIVEFFFIKIYGQDADTWITIVDHGLRELFREYTVHQREESIPKVESSLSTGDEHGDFDKYVSNVTCTRNQIKSELDNYLEEPLLPRGQDNFDLLGWWRLNVQKYPTLSKLASDILSIPASTVDRDSVFDTGLKKMKSYRSSLKPITLEALICTKDWIQNESTKFVR